MRSNSLAVSIAFKPIRSFATVALLLGIAQPALPQTPPTAAPVPVSVGDSVPSSGGLSGGSAGGSAGVSPAAGDPPSPSAIQSDAAGFAARVNTDLADHGVGAFMQQDTLIPGGAVYTPLRASVGGPFGSLFGMAELFLGVASNKQSSNGGYNNLELVTELNAGPHLKGHLQTNLINLPIKTAERRMVELPELYAEYTADGAMGSPGGKFHLSLRAGKIGQVQFPYLDPLTLFDRLPGHFFAYQGLLLMAEADQPGGGGAHVTLYERVGQTGGRGSQGLTDAYLLFRHTSPNGLFYESRLGWVSRVQVNAPASGGLGIQQYIGYHHRDYGVGFFYGDIFRQGKTVGLGITLARSSLSELFGLAPSHPLSAPDGLALEAPVAQVYLFTAARPREGEMLVGQEDRIRTWNAGSGIGVGTTDDLPAGRWGETGGRNVRRVAHITPWWLYNASFERLPTAAGRRLDTEYNLHFRSDLQYDYYQVAPVAKFAAQITAVEAGTRKPIPGARITLIGPNGFTRTVTTSRNGTANLRFQILNPGIGSFQITGAAKGYLPATRDVTLQPTGVNPIVVEFPPLQGGISGTVVDSLSGQPVPDAEAILQSEGAEPVVVTTGPDGAYRFTDLKPGAYTLSVHKPGYDDVKQPVSVAGGQTMTLNFKIVAQQGGIVARVVDADGNPVPGAALAIVDAAGKTISTLTTSAEGSAAQRLSAGTYTLNVSAPGYGPASQMVTVPAGALQTVTVSLAKAP